MDKNFKEIDKINKKGIPGMKWGINENFDISVPTSDDLVNHPSHYTQGDVECIDAIRSSMSTSEFLGYLKGNVQKYLWRYGQKDNPIQDLEKAQWYLKKLIEELKND